MRRITFYLAIGFLTFAASICVYISYTSWNETKPESEYSEKTKQAEIPQVQSEVVTTEQKTVFRCNDKFIAAVWNHLRENKMLAEVFDNGIRQNDLKDCSDVIGVRELFDLNGDGNQDALIIGKGWLNGINESSIWIVEKDKENYKVILDKAIGEYEIKKQKTKNFRDISISFKESIGESRKFLYQFDGSSYKLQKCWTEIIAARNKQDQIHELKKPLIRTMSCPGFE